MTFRLLLPLCFAAVFACGSVTGQEASPAQSAAKVDFGDYSSSTLATKAWKALEANDLEQVKAYTQKCAEMFEAKAVEMQAGITPPVDTSNKEKVFANWALNDVGTCYFILGSALEKAGDKKGAVDAYKKLVEKFSEAQCWDTKGWFWKPADAAKGKLKALEFDSIG